MVCRRLLLYRIRRSERALESTIFQQNVFCSIVLNPLTKHAHPGVVAKQPDCGSRKYIVCVLAAIPATVVAAASFDDAIAITGYTLFINLAVRSGGSTAWDVMHGPLSIVFGILAGGLAGLFCSATNLWNNNTKRTIVMFLTGAVHVVIMVFVFMAGAMCPFVSMILFAQAACSVISLGNQGVDACPHLCENLRDVTNQSKDACKEGQHRDLAQ